jgi:hypothetical protein
MAEHQENMNWYASQALTSQQIADSKARLQHDIDLSRAYEKSELANKEEKNRIFKEKKREQRKKEKEDQDKIRLAKEAEEDDRVAKANEQLRMAVLRRSTPVDLVNSAPPLPNWVSTGDKLTQSRSISSDGSDVTSSVPHASLGNATRHRRRYSSSDSDTVSHFGGFAPTRPSTWCER